MTFGEYEIGLCMGYAISALWQIFKDNGGYLTKNNIDQAFSSGAMEYGIGKAPNFSENLLRIKRMFRDTFDEALGLGRGGRGRE